MTYAQALWRLVAHHLSDPLPRLVLADCLDDQGDGELAGMLRSPDGEVIARAVCHLAFGTEEPGDGCRVEVDLTTEKLMLAVWDAIGGLDCIVQVENLPPTSSAIRSGPRPAGRRAFRP